MKFVMQRNHTVTAAGHAVKFTAGKAVHVPPELHRTVIGEGAVVSEEEDEAVDFSDAPAAQGAPENAAERAELIRMALGDIRSADMRENFTANGSPKVKAVGKIVGFDVSAHEINDLWSEMIQAAAGEGA